MTLKPNEQYSFLILLHPNDKTLSHATKGIDSGSTSSSKHSGHHHQHSMINVEHLKKLKKNEQQLAAQQEMEQNLCEIDTAIEVEYEVQGLSSQLIQPHRVRWNAVLKRGLFATVRCSAPIVTLDEMFTVTVGLFNMTNAECHLILHTMPNSNSGLMCYDAQIDVGKIKPLDSREVEIRFRALHEGFQAISDLFCINKLSNQHFMFPFSSEIYVKRSDEK